MVYVEACELFRSGEAPIEFCDRKNYDVFGLYPHFPGEWAAQRSSVGLRWERQITMSVMLWCSITQWHLSTRIPGVDNTISYCNIFVLCLCDVIFLPVLWQISFCCYFTYFIMSVHKHYPLLSFIVTVMHVLSFNVYYRYALKYVISFRFTLPVISLYRIAYYRRVLGIQGHGGHFMQF